MILLARYPSITTAIAIIASVIVGKWGGVVAARLCGEVQPHVKPGCFVCHVVLFAVRELQVPTW